MHDDRLDAGAAELVEELRTTFAATSAPPASDMLRSVFCGVATPTRTRAAHAIGSTQRSRFMFLEIFKSLPSKISAGALGAAIAIGGLGAAGALPGSMMLTSNEGEEAELVEGGEQEEVEQELEQEEVEQEDVEQEEVEEQEPTDLADVPVPTSVSEAAHTHAFDEACGNHGAYVSHFARFGEEPECATAARDASAAPEQQATTTASEDDTEPRDKGQSKSGKAKANKAGGKGKGGRR